MPNIRFPNMFDEGSGKVALVSNDTLNRQSLKSILLTSVNELMGDPSFGSNLKSCLFEIQSPLFRTLLQESISEAANKWVSRIEINSIQINVSEDSAENDQIVINYYSKDTGQPNIVELEVLSDGSLTIV